MNKLLPSLTALGGLFSLAASPAVLFAADNGPAPALKTPIEIVITAGRKQQAVTDTLAPVSVVTRAAIERSQAQTLGEVLTQLPGISLGNTGGVGKQTSVYMRGTNSNHVMVLIDGVKIGSATLGSTAFEFLPLSQVERIEVVRGPRSSLYGSEAIGGVIQIFTRKGSKQGFTPRASVSYGSNNTRKADVNLSGGNGNSWFNLNAAAERTDGFDALKTGTKTDDDGFGSKSFSIRAGHNFGNNIAAEISALRSSGHTEYDNNFGAGANDETEFLQQALSAKVSAPLGQNSKLSVQLGQSRDGSDTLEDSVLQSSINTKRNTASIQGETKLGNNSFVYGVDFQDDKVSGTQDYAVKSRDNTGFFASYGTSFGANDFAVSARRDNNEQFGSHTTGNIALSHKLNNGIKLQAAYGTAFKAPTFNELYWPKGTFYEGNPNLKPERSKTMELGISGELAQGRWSVNAFETKVEDLLVYVFSSINTQNVDEAEMRGIELEAATNMGNWRFSANATYQKTENLSNAKKGKQLIRRPEKLLNLNVDRRFGQLEIGATLHAEGSRYTNAANTNSLPGFATVDLRGKYQLNNNWAIGAKIGNLFDKEYETAKDYNQDGINGLLTLEYQPK